MEPILMGPAVPGQITIDGIPGFLLVAVFVGLFAVAVLADLRLIFRIGDVASVSKRPPSGRESCPPLDRRRRRARHRHVAACGRGRGRAPVRGPASPDGPAALP